MTRRNPGLYFFVLLLSGGIVTAALGGGLFGQHPPWGLQWQHQLFAGVCHQMPARSFWLFGQPMALCSRCFGIYAGFFLGWVMVLPNHYFKFPFIYRPPKVLVGLFLVNLIDVLGNWLGFWQNTLVSRFILGGMMGWAAATTFSGVFFTLTKTTKQESYGTIIASGTGG